MKRIISARLMLLETRMRPSWVTLNLITQYYINDNTTITASVENITDQRYKTYSSGIAASGRNFILALKDSLKA